MFTEYGSRLRAARKHASLTQHGLTARTGIPQSTIASAERQGRGSADTPIYAKALGVDPVWLATGEGEMVPVKMSALATDAARLIDAIADPIQQRRVYAVLVQIVELGSHVERVEPVAPLAPVATPVRDRTR